jgi:hypothetical protein
LNCVVACPKWQFEIEFLNILNIFLILMLVMRRIDGRVGR